MSFDLDEIGPFSIVDGRHHSFGFDLALKEVEKHPKKYKENAKEIIQGFEFSVNIADKTLERKQAMQFAVVNHTQEKVAPEILARIIANAQKKFAGDDWPTLPRLYRAMLFKGEQERSLEVVEHLRKSKDSPWFGRIAAANTKRKKGDLNENTFRQHIARFVLLNNNHDLCSDNLLCSVYLNYWKSIPNLLDNGKSKSLYLANAERVFSIFFTTVVYRLRQTSKRDRYTTATFAKHLKPCLQNLVGSYSEMGTPQYWEDAKLSFPDIAPMVQTLTDAFISQTPDDDKGQSR